MTPGSPVQDRVTARKAGFPNPDRQMVLLSLFLKHILVRAFLSPGIIQDCGQMFRAHPLVTLQIWEA